MAAATFTSGCGLRGNIPISLWRSTLIHCIGVLRGNGSVASWGSGMVWKRREVEGFQGENVLYDRGDDPK